MIIVDQLRDWGWHHGPSSHLISTLPGKAGTEELITFAEALGIKRKWLQKSGTHREHFDLNERAHLEAIHAGALQVDWRVLVRAIRAKKEGKSFPVLPELD